MFCRSRERLNKGINNACLDLTKFSLDPLMKTKKKDKSFSYVDFAYADINNHLFTRDTKFLFFN